MRSVLIEAAVLCALLVALVVQEARADAAMPATLVVPPTTLYLPQIMAGSPITAPITAPITPPVDASACPSTSTASYDVVPVYGACAEHPAAIHADLNLSVRGFVTATATLSLIEMNGPTDWDPPRLGSLLVNRPQPEFAAAYAVNGWDWGCVDAPEMPWAGHGCRAVPLVDPPVTLLAMTAAQGEALLTPYRRAEIYPARVVALVLYADEARVTLGYTREDSAAVGYVVHLEGVCVDANLLALYRSLDAAGRRSLPGLHSLEQLGSASGSAVKVAVRDTGSFMDPRSRKDWWQSD